MVDFVRRGSTRTELPADHFVRWLGITTSKCYDWRTRYGHVNENNAWVPRDHWLAPCKREAILDFHRTHPEGRYRRLTYMMLDADTMAVSPATTSRVLRAAGLLRRWNTTPSKKATGCVRPLAPHDHWHVDIAYLHIAATFYFLCRALDGCRRVIVHWELRERMTAIDVELTLQRAREHYPDARPRIISDNGPPFIAKDFKEFIRLFEKTHVRTSPSGPQSLGKLERWHHSFKPKASGPTSRSRWRTGVVWRSTPSRTTIPSACTAR